MSTAAEARGAPAPRHRRLDVDVRREELLRLGLELFSSRASDEVEIGEIAERAGISRGLLYHYFPTKRDYYVAVSRLAIEEVGMLTEPQQGQSAATTIIAGITAYLAYAEAHAHGFLTAHRGAMAGDPEIRAMVERSRRRQASRILAAVDARRTPLVRLAVHGWIALVQDVVVRWLPSRRPPRQVVARWLAAALDAALGAAVETENEVHRSR